MESGKEQIGDVGELVERGLQLYGEGDLVGALDSWRQALVLEPDNEQVNEFLVFVERHYQLSAGDKGGGESKASASLEQQIPFGLAGEAGLFGADDDAYESFELVDSNDSGDSHVGAGIKRAPSEADDGWFLEAGRQLGVEPTEASGLIESQTLPRYEHARAPGTESDLGAASVELALKPGEDSGAVSMPTLSGDDATSKGALADEAIAVEEEFSQDATLERGATNAQLEFVAASHKHTQTSDWYSETSRERTFEYRSNDHEGDTRELTAAASAALTDDEQLQQEELSDEETGEFRQRQIDNYEPRTTLDMSSLSDAINEEGDEPQVEFLRMHEKVQASDAAEEWNQSSGVTADVAVPPQLDEGANTTNPDVPAPHKDEDTDATEHVGFLAEEKNRIAYEVSDVAPIADGGPELRSRLNELVERAISASESGVPSDALAALELLHEERPDSAITQKTLHARMEEISKVYRDYLGGLEAVVELAISLNELPLGELEHRSAFLASRMEEPLAVEELLDVSGMPSIEALRYLSKLMVRGIIRRHEDQ